VPAFDKGEPALRDYSPVRYSHLATDPGEGPLLTADPWSYLRAHFGQKIPSTKGANRRRFERALYYVRLAEDFYSATERHERTAGVVAYYAMLNLVKAYLSSSGVELETSLEHHGLTMPVQSDTCVDVLSKADKGHIHIFHEFARLLGTPVTARTSVELLEIATHIPELHDVAWKLGHLTTAKRKFLPVHVDLLVNSDRTYLFSELRFEKRHESAYHVHKFLRGARKEYFKEPRTEDGWVI